MAKFPYYVSLSDYGRDDYAYPQFVANVRAKTSYKALCKALKIDNLDANTKFYFDGYQFSIDFVEVGPDYTRELQANIKNIDNDLILVTDCGALVEISAICEF